MMNKEVDKMASTKHKNLPGKVKKESLSISTLKEMVREEFTNIVNEVTSVDKIKKDLVKTIDALKKNIPLFLSAKKSGDENKSNKYKDVAIKLTKLKKKLETEMDKALGTLHSDAELELEYQDPRADAEGEVNEVWNGPSQADFIIPYKNWDDKISKVLTKMNIKHRAFGDPYAKSERRLQIANKSDIKTIENVLKKMAGSNWIQETTVIN